MTDQIAQHLRQLAVEIGPRPIGSAANHAAAEYIRRVFQSAGLDVQTQRIDCPAWTHLETGLELMGGPWRAAANPFSPACEVVAPLVAASTWAELEALDLTGRIVVLCGDLTQEPLIPRNCLLYNAERDQAINQRLIDQRPAAVLTVNLRPGSLTRLIEDWCLPVPSATVPAETGLALLQRLGETAHLTIATQSGPGHSANIVGRTTDRLATHLVVCAHYDTKLETPGALDNGGGVAVLLALAQQLPQRDRAVGLEFVAFTGEEYSNGEPDAEYLRLKGADLGNVLAAINLDGIGYALGANTITLLAHSPAFQAQVAASVAKYAGVQWVAPWPQSNHSTFAGRGVPSLALSSIGAFDLAHQPIDTVDWVSLDKLREVASLVTAIVDGVQHAAVAWTRPHD